MIQKIRTIYSKKYGGLMGVEKKYVKSVMVIIAKDKDTPFSIVLALYSSSVLAKKIKIERLIPQATQMKM
jgi:hypothetical protein